MSFASPLSLLFLLPMLFVAYRLLRYGRKTGIKFSAVSFLPEKTSGWRAKVAAFYLYLLILGLSLLVIAAARPRSPLAKAQKSLDAIAIAMTVDVSGSMDALDLTPEGTQFSRDTTRLAIVKKLFAEFVEKRPEDLITLVTFGGYASTRVPLTADHGVLLHALKGVEIPAVAVDQSGRAIGGEEQMTAIGDGLATSLARLKEAELKSKVVILLSDGVSNCGAVEPDEAAKVAAEMGVKVYAIGIGTKSSRTPIISRDLFGRSVVQYVDMTFDEAQLKSIAETTGGKYFPVDDKEALSSALKEIDELETTKIDTSAYDRWNEHFPLFLLLGALSVLVSTTLSFLALNRPA